ncbi:MAG: outer membrane beta-barrel family protein, partial [Muribaculaceae bacterium]|nr:outer membrane beta-barrel family protein [Muribaculaceae bacterium]
HNIRAGLRLQWEPDSFNTLDFRPNFSYFLNDTERNSYGENFNATDAISQSRNISSSTGHGYDLNGRLIYNWKSKSRRGRSFSVSANYQLSDTREDETVWSRNAFWMRDSLYEDYQEIDNHTWNNGVNSRITYVEPIGNVKNGNFMEFAYMMNYRWNNADKDVMHQPFAKTGILADPDYEQWQEDIWRDWHIADRITGLNKDDLTLDGVNSNHFRNDFFSQQLRIGYRKVAAKYNLNAGISFNPSMSKSVNLTNSDKTIPTRWVWNYAPFLRFRYKHSKQTSLNMFYFGRSTQPSLTQLQPVADTSDPMNIVQGNPSLDPSFTHSLRLRYQTNDPDKQQSIMVMGFAQMEQNAVVSN